MPHSARNIAILNLTNTINNKHNSQLTTAQVEHWVGSDANATGIDMHTSDVRHGDGVTPPDVLGLWNETQ